MSKPTIISTDPVVMDTRKVAAWATMPGSDSLGDVQFKVIQDELLNKTLLLVEKRFPVQKADEPGVAFRDVEMKFKPRWMPKRLWNRVPTKSQRVAVKYQAYWAYPEFKISTLGTARAYLEVLPPQEDHQIF